MSGKDELPVEMKHAIENFDYKLKELEAVLEPFLNEEKSLLPRLSPVDTAKLNLTVSYSIATLFARTHTKDWDPFRRPLDFDMNLFFDL